MATIIEIIETLQNLTNSKISQSDIARALNVTRATISKRVSSGSQLTFDEMGKLEEYFRVPLSLEDGIKNLEVFPLNFGIMTIPYWEELPEDMKALDIPVTIPTELIKNHWYLNPDNLRIVPMVGDKMTNYWYRINENDILIIDTSHNFIRGNGVYFATSRNNTRFWIREMQALINDDIQIKGFAPSGETTKVFTPKQLEDVDFKIIGKVIKNVSFRL